MRRGEDLVAKDLITGKSDPYVKFKCAGQKVRRGTHACTCARTYDARVHVHVLSYYLRALRPTPMCMSMCSTMKMDR